jgi:HD-GYP domain-containing protein (c-di-GMP phosphodiesterase class II)
MEHELLLAYDTTIEGWMRALGLKDRETEGHSYRLAGLSLALARALDLENDELIHLRYGALLHDIGKMGIPDAILNKPGPLSDAEWGLMRRHPEFGFEILSPIPFLGPAAQIAFCHHENWDGSGYPRGLQGENIPLLARILSVCNVYDSLISDQPYRNGWGTKVVVGYIEETAGKQFDPEIVVAFIRLMSREH